MFPLLVFAGHSRSPKQLPLSLELNSSSVSHVYNRIISWMASEVIGKLVLDISFTSLFFAAIALALQRFPLH